MINRTAAVGWLICREGVFREAIEHALHQANLAAVHAFSFLSPQRSSLTPAPDLIVYVDMHSATRDLARDAGCLDRLPDTRWLVLSDDPENAVYERLRSLNREPCAAPLNLETGDLCSLIRLAAGGRRFVLDQFTQAAVPGSLQRLKGAQLSCPQWTLLRCLAEGLSNKEISRVVLCDETEVKSRVRTLLKRLDLTNRTQAAVLAARAGLHLDVAKDRAERIAA